VLVRTVLPSIELRAATLPKTSRAAATNTNPTNLEQPAESKYRILLREYPSAKMLKEVVSLAIILSFIINLVFVPHPNSSSYTIYFVLSLLAISPFLALWRLWLSPRAARELEPRDVASMGLVSVSDAFGAISDADLGLGADLEKGLVADVGEIVELKDPADIKGAVEPKFLPRVLIRSASSSVGHFPTACQAPLTIHAAHICQLIAAKVMTLAT
jgi:hypothetical protein